MNIKEFKRLNLSSGTILELRLEKPDVINIDGHTIQSYHFLGCFSELVESLPEYWGEGSRREDHAKTPFIVIGFFGDHNRCWREYREYSLDNIRNITVYSKS